MTSNRSRLQPISPLVPYFGCRIFPPDDATPARRPRPVSRQRYGGYPVPTRFVQPRYARLSRCGGTRFRFWCALSGNTLSTCTPRPISIQGMLFGRLGAMAGTQYRGATAENRRLPQRSRTLWRPMFLKHRLPKKLAGIERVLELPNRRSRIFPKTKPQRSIPQTRHRPTSYPLHHTRQTVVVRLRRDSFYRSLLAILLRRLAESVISGKEPLSFDYS